MGYTSVDPGWLDHHAPVPRACSISTLIEAAADDGGRRQALHVLTLAQRTADEHIASARQQAEKIQADAQAKAEQIVRDAQARAYTVREETEQALSEARAKAEQIATDAQARADQARRDAEAEAEAGGDVGVSSRAAQPFEVRPGSRAGTPHGDG